MFTIKEIWLFRLQMSQPSVLFANNNSELRFLRKKLPFEKKEIHGNQV